MDQKISQSGKRPFFRLPSLTVILVGVVVVAVLANLGFYWYQRTKYKKEIIPLNFIGEKVAGDYQWTDTTLEAKYAKVPWDKIIATKLVGLSYGGPLVEKKTDGCGASDGGDYLRIEGGLCATGYWLEDSNGTKIDSKEKLAARFAPIKSETVAASYVAVTQSSLVLDEDGIPAGNTLTITDGFLVQLFYGNAYGCGTHQLTGVIYKVSSSGEIKQIAAEKEKPPQPGEPIICVD
ncbi:MAG: hypothetical protein PHE24_01290 [Patescibacteria group bacterium]|nr:hypothetical protein [Patescibacteria group bacterium]